MKHEERIIEAFKSSKIERILLIDDAYDPPEINENSIGVIQDFLESGAGKTLCSDAEITKADLKSATDAAIENDYDNDVLNKVYSTLYNQFVKTDKNDFDPGDHFRDLKGASLEALKPLQVLLSNCGEQIEVSTAGLNEGGTRYRDFQPQVLFLDYYLDSEVPVTGDVGTGDLNKARRKSLDFLESVVSAESGEEIPAIVLMSSKEINDVENYRHQVKNKPLSLRFGFIKKESIRQEINGFIVAPNAADVLLDTSQGYLFGKALQQALSGWISGAEKALECFKGEIGDLHTKDFAYLMRFRLQEEGQTLSEYLEWFFGESLKGLVDKKVDWNHDSFSLLDGTENMIEGAIEGPSVNMVKIFHRIRVNERSHCTSGRYRLGDLYVQPEGRNIRAVVTPDCDLVERKGKMKVDRVLTMGGTLDKVEQPDSFFTDNLFIQNEIPYSIRWNPKDIRTYSAKGSDSLHDTKDLCFRGTLNPLYAQAMQRLVLTDFSRIGLPVAPALGFNATVKVWIRMQDASDPFKRIKIKSPNLATIILAREGQAKGHQVLFSRRFADELIDYLRNIDETGLGRDTAGPLRQALEKEETLYKYFLQEGIPTKSKGKYKMGLVIGNGPNKKEDAPWLQFTVSVSDEALEELQTIDPLAS